MNTLISEAIDDVKKAELEIEKIINDVCKKHEDFTLSPEISEAKQFHFYDENSIKIFSVRLYPSLNVWQNKIHIDIS